jgi:hypothetical protein
MAVLHCSFRVAGTLAGQVHSRFTLSNTHERYTRELFLWLMTPYPVQVSWFPDLQAWHRSPTRGRQGQHEPDTEVHSGGSASDVSAEAIIVYDVPPGAGHELQQQMRFCVACPWAYHLQSCHTVDWT